MSYSAIVPEQLPKYLEAPVGNYITAPLLPYAGELRLNELITPDDICRESRVQIYDETTGMALIDKRFAHATREVMWMHAAEEPVATLTEYLDTLEGQAKAEKLFTVLGRSACAAEELHDYATVSWSSDPLTHHRPSIQGEKRLHFHLASRNGELSDIDSITMPVGELNFVDRQRIAEDYSFVASAYLRDILAQNGIQASDNHPCVLSVPLPEWDQIGSHDSVQTITHVLRLIEAEYAKIVGCLGGEDDYGRLYTPSDSEAAIANFKELCDLDPNTEGYIAMTRYLQDLIAKSHKADNNPKYPRTAENTTGNFKGRLMTALTPATGFAYSGNISRYNGNIFLNIRPCKFSDLGGAGCAIINGMPVRVKKGGTLISAEGLEKRYTFVENMKLIAAEVLSV